MMLEIEVEALEHLVRVLNGEDAYFQSFKLSPSDISKIFERSYLRNVEGFRLLGLLFELTNVVNRDKRLEKALQRTDIESYLFEDVRAAPAVVIENYMKTITELIKEYPDVFLGIPVEGAAVNVGADDDVDEAEGVYQAESPMRRSSAFTRKFSNLKLRRTSTKSLSSVQSSTLSNDTAHTSMHSVVELKYDPTSVNVKWHSSPRINVESVMKNIIFQFVKMFEKISSFYSRYQGIGVGASQIAFLKTTVNDSIVVLMYDMLTEYSLKLLDDEMFDINNQILRV